MKEYIKKLAIALWSNEEYKPSGAAVGWSCADNQEFDEMNHVINKQASYIEYLEDCLLALDNAFEVSDEAYRSWRRMEAYQVPGTEEGVRKANERLLEFNKAFIAGVKASALALERLHSQAKSQHNFYLFAKNAVEGLTYKPPVP
jgi:hypothetical protein